LREIPDSALDFHREKTLLYQNFHSTDIIVQVQAEQEFLCVAQLFIRAA